MTRVVCNFRVVWLCHEALMAVIPETIDLTTYSPVTPWVDPHWQWHTKYEKLHLWYLIKTQQKVFSRRPYKQTIGTNQSALNWADTITGHSLWFGKGSSNWNMLTPLYWPFSKYTIVLACTAYVLNIISTCTPWSYMSLYSYLRSKPFLQQNY